MTISKEAARVFETQIQKRFGACRVCGTTGVRVTPSKIFVGETETLAALVTCKGCGLLAFFDATIALGDERAASILSKL